MTLLAVRNLVVEYAGEPTHGRAPVRAVSGVTFAIAAGRTLGLVGESGCGKTTTALALLGLLPPAARIVEGTAHFAGEDLLSSKRALERLRGDRIAIVFQDAHAAHNPVLPVGDQVGEPLRIHRGHSARQARTEAIELLRQVGVADPARVAASFAHQLSGGMLARASIAAAIACRPALLIADEPTAALDVTVQAQVLALLDRLRAEHGMALLLITHDLALASERCDDVAVMYAGEIVEQAPAAELFARPAHPYTAGLLRALPRLAGDASRLDAIPGAAPTAGAWPTGCRFRDRCSFARPRCEAEAPALIALGASRVARCHFPLVEAAA